MANYKNGKIIETKELPIVTICAYCDKPIFVGDEYDEVQYFDDARKKRIDKKKLINGYAHKHCIEKKESEVAALKAKFKKKKQLVLALSIVSGFIISLGLMVLLLFLDKTPMPISIIIPWIIGYLLISETYVLALDEHLGFLWLRLFRFFFRLPIILYRSSIGDVAWYIVIKVILIVFLVPIGYALLIILFAFSLLTSAIYFPFSFMRKE